MGFSSKPRSTRSLFPKLERTVLKTCAALDVSTMARWEPTVQIPIVWDYEVRGAPDFRGEGRRYAVVFRWLWAMRKTIEQGFRMTFLLANLRRNASL